jgi:hypothetical protein
VRCVNSFRQASFRAPRFAAVKAFRQYETGAVQIGMMRAFSENADELPAFRFRYVGKALVDTIVAGDCVLLDHVTSTPFFDFIITKNRQRSNISADFYRGYRK